MMPNWGNRPRRDPTIWVTRDKKEIPISKMEDSHITNAIRHLRKITTEERLLGWPAYINLLAEAKKRGIDGREDWDS